MSKTFYFWDLADTLFPEHWDPVKSGQPSFAAYLESLGFNIDTISPLDYERAYERPYCEDFFNLNLNSGFVEVLNWTKYNGVFTTGNPEQIDWRAGTLKKKFNVNIRDYLKETHSTFDYGNTNLKTTEMYQDLLQKKRKEGYDTIVYTDDKEKNCLFFLKAARGIEGLKVRAYHITNSERGIISQENGVIEVGSLLDIKKNEELI